MKWYPKALVGLYIFVLTIPAGLSAQEYGVVEGLVTKAGTAEALSGATVTLTSEAQRYSGTTGTEGRFSIRVAPGRYRPAAQRENYIGQARPPGPATFIAVGAGQRVRDVKLELHPPSAVSGRIMDRDGNPAEGVEVHLLVESYARGVRLLKISGPEFTTTNGSGEFRLGPVMPGEYYVVASPPNQKRDFAPSFYPGVSLIDDAQKIIVSPGKETLGTTFTLTRDSLFSVRLRLSDTVQIATGMPIRITTELQRRDGFETLPFVDFDSVGANSYVIPRLAPGLYHVHVSWGPGYGEPQPTADLLATIVDRDVDLGAIRFGSIRTITGRTFETQNGVAVPILGQMRLIQKLTNRGMGGVQLIELAAEGNFTAKLPEGRYDVELPGLSPHSYIASIRYAGREMLGTGLVIDSDPTGPVEIRVATGTGGLKGMVHNEKGERIYFARVSLWPLATMTSSPAWAQSTATDVEGAFSFSNVPPGDYSMIALETVLSSTPSTQSWDASKDVEFMRQFEKEATKVLVGPGSTQFVDLRIIHNFK